MVVVKMMIVMNHDDHGGNSHISDISKLQFSWKVWTNFTGGLNVCQSCQFWPKYLHDILMSILKAGILGPWGLVSPPPVPWYLSLDGAPSVKIHMCQCAIFPPHHNSPVCLNKQTDCAAILSPRTTSTIIFLEKLWIGVCVKSLLGLNII